MKKKYINYPYHAFRCCRIKVSHSWKKTCKKWNSILLYIRKLYPTLSTITTVISDRYPIYLILNKWTNENHHFLIISYTDSTIGWKSLFVSKCKLCLLVIRNISASCLGYVLRNILRLCYLRLSHKSHMCPEIDDINIIQTFFI